MATKEVKYETGANGYNAMVADFTEIFTWDEIEPNDGSDTYTTFKKLCKNDTYIGIQIKQSNSSAPTINAFVYNGASSVALPSSLSSLYTAYVYGDGFFVVLISSSSIPNSGNRSFLGISTCRNIITGETSWCTFSQICNK